jgi:hypothetical protein
MDMTPAQIATLKAYILADPTLSVKATQGDYDYLANALNALASPAFRVYRNSVPMSEIMLNGFNWTRVDNLSVGKARIWEWMIGADPNSHNINPSKANVRAGINAVWVGTAPDLAVRAAVYLHCFRDATLAEKLLKTAGTGTAADSTGEGPATLGWEGTIQSGDMGVILS